MVHVEFTIEPFVEDRPGTHVVAAIDAAREHGADVEVGPFGSGCSVAEDEAGTVVGAIVAAAVANGASHVSIHVERS